MCSPHRARQHRLHSGHEFRAQDGLLLLQHDPRQVHRRRCQLAVRLAGGRRYRRTGSGVPEHAVPRWDRGHVRSRAAEGERSVSALHACEDHSTGFGNVILAASFDNGATWSDRIQVNDNANPNVDEFQPNLAVAASGAVSVNFYDRRLVCPAQGTAEAVGAGLALDTLNLNFSEALPPYGASNYCMEDDRSITRPARGSSVAGATLVAERLRRQAISSKDDAFVALELNAEPTQSRG